MELVQNVGKGQGNLEMDFANMNVLLNQVSMMKTLQTAGIEEKMLIVQTAGRSWTCAQLDSSFSNPNCETWHHSVCTDLGESTKKALAVVFWLCPECATSLKPIWVNIEAEPEAMHRNDSVSDRSTRLSQLFSRCKETWNKFRL